MTITIPEIQFQFGPLQAAFLIVYLAGGCVSVMLTEFMGIIGGAKGSTFEKVLILFFWPLLFLVTVPWSIFEKKRK